MRSMQLTIASCFFGLTCALACVDRLAASDTWPQFRGPDGQGHSDAHGVATSWSEQQHVSWKTALPGQGWSSPVIADSRVWMTTATDEGKSLRALCVDFATGKLLHDLEIFHVDQPVPVHETNSHASPTPILDGAQVYVHFGTNGTACLNAKTGDTIWKNTELHWDHQVGPGSSPALYQDLLLLNCDGTDVQFAAALNKQTGNVVWNTPRSGVIDKPFDQKKAFCTPLVIHADGRDQVIMTAAEWVYSLDPRTGEELWHVKHPGFSTTPKPVFGDGLVFIGTGFMTPEIFAIRPEGRGAIDDKAVAWRFAKGAPTKPSPLLVGDDLYLVSDGGVLTCLNAKSGKVHYQQRLSGKYSASPTFVDDLIYIDNEEGRTIVFKPGHKYDEVAVNQLDGRFMASMAVVGKSLVLRTDTHLYRIDP